MVLYAAILHRYLSVYFHFVRDPLEVLPKLKVDRNIYKVRKKLIAKEDLHRGQFAPLVVNEGLHLQLNRQAGCYQKQHEHAGVDGIVHPEEVGPLAAYLGQDLHDLDEEEIQGQGRQLEVQEVDDGFEVHASVVRSEHLCDLQNDVHYNKQHDPDPFVGQRISEGEHPHEGDLVDPRENQQQEQQGLHLLSKAEPLDCRV